MIYHEYKVNKPVAHHRVGDVIKIQVNADGTPVDVYWRRRLADAASDNCIERTVSTQKKGTK